MHDALSPRSPAESARDAVTAAFALVLPEEPLPVRLMNTIWADRSGVHDVLTSAANLRVWLAAVRSEDHMPGANAEDLVRFRALRDALRRLAALITDDDRPAASSATRYVGQAVADLNDAAGQAPTWPQLAYRNGELRRVTAGGHTAAGRSLSAIAYESVELFTGERRIELRACSAPGCVLYFVKDHPRREWCSAACGNRARAARHYQRHHGKA